MMEIEYREDVEALDPDSAEGKKVAARMTRTLAAIRYEIETRKAIEAAGMSSVRAA